nr:immunoglobulin heavy chain junction region [Macaca mulatta]MOX15912.1 immunoglobulin heavy chain junction region [Macaca mulatta]MOX15924.1 immunoglobulin heavy chain junction region [Macaca mulatta]MOX16191.1 immunoglobulin heavy chain junction region [Macaca mulatta]MOX16369.1 immunoglobulin heavy chain junction region [Macaca mulatta]
CAIGGWYERGFHFDYW